MANRTPLVTVIIPHWNGEEVLSRCLTSLGSTEFRDYQVLVVDNGSTDGSVAMIRSRFPRVEVEASPVNLGFAGGCNLGIRRSKSPFVVLLNNDTVVTPDWLAPLVRTAEEDPKAAAVQPKLLSIRERERFDYCGGAGGEMDIFGYPFARGRLFNDMEKDTCQYDSGRTVFWATGAASLLRREALERAGLLDEYFFAHMEEIDLNWRFHIAGYQIRVVPEAVVYHQTGGTLHQESLKKMVLNHRNALLMFLKNYELKTLFRLLPLRLALEGLTVGGSVLMGQPRRALAVAAGIIQVMRGWRVVLKGRKQVAGLRVLRDKDVMKRMYGRSVALAYFLKGVRRVTDLPGWSIK